MPLFSILILAAMFAYFLYETRWSRMARDTRELARLNRIWRLFNERACTTREIRDYLDAYDWKFHQDKVELLRTFITLFEERAPRA